jgi:two-component system chemotaxis response regulator CheY
MKLRAMVVDDSSVMRSMVMRGLLWAGLGDFEFVEAQDGEVALQRFSPEEFDILFVDWNMPNMNGIDLVRAIRSREDSAHIPIVMVSSERSEAKIGEALYRAGANGWITKPFTEDLLHGKLKRIVDEVVQRRENPTKGFFGKLQAES